MIIIDEIIFAKLKYLKMFFKLNVFKENLLCKGKLTNEWGLGGLLKAHSKLG